MFLSWSLMIFLPVLYFTPDLENIQIYTCACNLQIFISQSWKPSVQSPMHVLRAGHVWGARGAWRISPTSCSQMNILALWGNLDGQPTRRRRVSVGTKVQGQSFQNIWYSVVIFHLFVFCYYWDFKNPLLSVRHFRVFVATVRGGTVCKTIRNKLVLL